MPHRGTGIRYAAAMPLPDDAAPTALPPAAPGNAWLRGAGALLRVLAVACGAAVLWAAYERGPRYLLGLLGVPVLRSLGRVLWAAGAPPREPRG